MAGNAGNDEDGITGINVTPLVDVMLVLLIIFMVTTTMITNPSIQVKLPQAASGEVGINTQLAFTIDKNSIVYLNGKEIAFPEIKQKIDEYKAQGKPLQAIIGADRAVPHGIVIKLMDTVRSNGIYDFALDVEAQ